MECLNISTYLVLIFSGYFLSREEKPLEQRTSKSFDEIYDFIEAHNAFHHDCILDALLR